VARVPAHMEWGAGFPTPLHHQRPVPGLGDGPDRAAVSSESQHSRIGSRLFHCADAPSRSGGQSVLVSEDLGAFVFTSGSTTVKVTAVIDRMLTWLGNPTIAESRSQMSALFQGGDYVASSRDALPVVLGGVQPTRTQGNAKPMTASAAHTCLHRRLLDATSTCGRVNLRLR